MDADQCLLPFWETSEVSRFMERAGTASSRAFCRRHAVTKPSESL